ncbi:hypothetical protein FA15DRAFT_669796 [Coprinopsis marcescibilis]|uniref:Uncharacterized protein n=1 Tax=Coprinopsis marcescibilis TaxID=230819 RepID=A0A5C3L7C4_COPMA|nr:hypothetical protein FA15DRAFT_669796 [Coprinopsis marcescibilis]
MANRLEVHPDMQLWEWNLGGGGTTQQHGREFKGISYFLPFLIVLEWHLKRGNKVANATCTQEGVYIWMDTEDELWGDAPDSPEGGEAGTTALLEVWLSLENLKPLGSDAIETTSSDSSNAQLFIFNAEPPHKTSDRGHVVINTLNGMSPLERFVRVLQRIYAKRIIIQEAMFTPQVAHIMISPNKGDPWVETLSPFVDI